MKDRPPFFLRLQIDEVFGIEKAGRIRAVIRPSGLTGALRDFGKRAKNDSRLIRHPDTFVRPGAGRKRAPHPERAFIQVGQEFGTDDAAEREVKRKEKPDHADTQHQPTPANRPPDRASVVL